MKLWAFFELWTLALEIVKLTADQVIYRADAAEDLLCNGAGFCAGCQALLSVVFAQAAVDSEGNEKHRQDGDGKQGEDHTGQEHVDEPQHRHHRASQRHTDRDGACCL